MIDIKQLIEKKMQPESFTWWGHDYVDVVPALVHEPLGDGQVLLRFFSLDCRPNAWLVQVDSSIRNLTDEEEEEYIESVVIKAIANEYGECDCEDNCDCRFPVLLLWTGCGWDIIGGES